MKILTKDNSVIIKNIKDFNPTHTFMCGQCFRWDVEEDGSYTGIAHGKVVNISHIENDIVIKNTNIDDVENIWIDYLDLKRDYDEIKNNFSCDENLKRAMDFGGGIKILNQDIFECLISFIISTQNGIPRIKKIVSAMSELFGDKIEYDNKTYHSFPDIENLAGITEKDLEPLKAGYRAGYIVDAVKKVKSGEVDIYSLKDMSTSDARCELMKIKGVGPKVADCVLLFSAGKSDAFPIDVWVQRIMRSLYCGEDAKIKDIQDFASSNFGKYAGIAQQYLFYYAREND